MLLTAHPCLLLTPPLLPPQSTVLTGKAQRTLAAKQHREIKKAEVLQEKRAGSALPKARSTPPLSAPTRYASCAHPPYIALTHCLSPPL